MLFSQNIDLNNISKSIDTVAEDTFRILSEMGESLPEDRYCALLCNIIKREPMRTLLFAKLAKGELSETAAKFVSMVQILET